MDLTNISSSTLLSFSANVDEIMQVLRYLLGNAAKCSQPGDSISLSASIAESHPSPSLVSFTPLSMKSIRASISSVHVGDLLKMDEPSYSLILRVADSGIGMSTVRTWHRSVVVLFKNLGMTLILLSSTGGPSSRLF